MEKHLSVKSECEDSSFDNARAERNLMIAILRNAADDLKHGGKTRRESLEFFLSEDHFYLYSFVSICDYLNLCPHKIRSLLGLRRSARMQRLAA